MQIINEALDKAKTELSNLLSEEVFLVKALYKGYEWNQFSQSGRLFIGSLFLNFFKNSDMRIFAIEKTSSAQQKCTKYSFVRRMLPC